MRGVFGGVRSRESEDADEVWVWGGSDVFSSAVFVSVGGVEEGRGGEEWGVS